MLSDESPACCQPTALRLSRRLAPYLKNLIHQEVVAFPQAPVLFTGTLRNNLTPFGEHSDAECWAALRRAHLAAMVEASPAGLDLVLSEGGAPLSAGQKQLVAMARALLRRSKVSPSL